MWRQEDLFGFGGLQGSVLNLGMRFTPKWDTTLYLILYPFSNIPSRVFNFNALLTLAACPAVTIGDARFGEME